MPSKQANRVLEELLDENDSEGVPFEQAVNKVRDICDVADNTAEAYVRRSDKTHIETTLEGEKIVVSPGGNGETVVHDEDEVIEMAAGERTGSYFGSLGVLEDVGHPEVEEQHRDGYIRRRMGDDDGALSRKTDVQVFTAALEIPDASVLLIGKHGVGKDKLALHCCANTNRPTLRMVANDDPDFIDLLIGSYAPDENGDFHFKKGLLTIAIEYGYTFILDEFNNLSGKLQTMLNMILEESDKQSALIPETNEVIDVHPEFRFIGTQNPNEVGYGGREDLDAATSSRFIPIEVPPLDEKGEKKVVAQNTHWDENDAALDLLLREDGGVISGIRALHDMGKISTWPSTRDVMQIGWMAEKLGDAQSAAELVLVGRADPEDKTPIRDNIHDQNW